MTKEEKRAYGRKWYSINREKKRKRMRDAYWKNLDRSRAMNRAKYQKNREGRCADSIAYYYRNKEARKEYAREYRKKNPEKVRLANKCWRYSNPEECLEWQRQYAIKNKDRRRRTQRDSSRRLRLNPVKRLNDSVSTSMRQSLKGRKEGHFWEGLVGYTLQELVAYMESLFTGDMSWDNYGRNGWHIDHIVPKSWFNYEIPEDPEFKECWGLDNLQPMWESDNASKGNRFTG